MKVTLEGVRRRGVTLVGVVAGYGEVEGGPGPGVGPSLDFSVASNSQYLGGI